MRRVLMAVAFVVTCAQAQSQSQEAREQDALTVQSARNKTVRGRAAKKMYTYTGQWNLNSLPQYMPDGDLPASTIRIWGNNYIGDSGLVMAWEEGFRKYHPDVQFSYNLPTALMAIPGLVTGLADLGVSRPLTWDELITFQRVFSYDPLEIVMATGSFNLPGWADASSIIVHKDNPISKLTLRQLDGIFGAERMGGYQGTTWHPEVARGASENIRTWGQLGLTGEWKDAAINVYAVNLRFHVNRMFERVVFKGGDKWNERLREYANFAQPGGIGSGRWLLEADVGKDRYGIGISRVEAATPQTKTLALAATEGGPYIELTIDNVQNRTYPLINETCWYVNRRPGQPMDPKVKAYLKYVLSREGQEAVARDAKFLPLTAEVVREQLKKLE